MYIITTAAISSRDQSSVKGNTCLGQGFVAGGLPIVRSLSRSLKPRSPSMSRNGSSLAGTRSWPSFLLLSRASRQSKSFYWRPCSSQAGSCCFFPHCFSQPGLARNASHLPWMSSFEDRKSQANNCPTPLALRMCSMKSLGGMLVQIRTWPWRTQVANASAPDERGRAKTASIW